MEPLAILQGAYFLITGVWPLFSIRTFQMVTGPKNDLWLVKTVGVTIAAIGAPLILAGVRGEVNPAIVLLAVGSAAGLGAIDVFYSLKKVILPVYLLDAAVEAVLVIWWGILVMQRWL